ncbi:bifunctional enoyl-CoA hydratase/phosphate acetyltransferase [Methylohalobius crimeensis]|uniref:bifunctional enoyl-CoA hydratase/phosphate acetyltransferase n=1 Tax=Methylohalobius crimeensis TaxID=244365 RepID=UPI0003B710CA|nr:bifunctional enoyl-CoA hydratase/phosphate acetyltransferase [Methylohalobius crimeensis]
MDLVTLDSLIERASDFPPLPMAVVDAGEAYVLEGAREATDAGLLQPVLLGRKPRIEKIAAEIGFSLAEVTLIDAGGEKESASKGVELVAEGQVHGLMKGWIHTDVLMHPVLKHLRTERRVSHVFLAELPAYPKLLYVTDAAINIAPDLKQKAAIVQNAVDLARLLGVPLPKVAALSALEIVKPEIASTIDAACLSKMAQRRQIHHAVVDGPLAFDNAISKDAARIKQIDSDVAGEVDILLAPDLNAGNILAKDLAYLAQATLAGIVVGAKVPIVLPSRSDPPKGRLASCAIAVLMHHLWEQFRRENETQGEPG